MAESFKNTLLQYIMDNYTTCDSIPSKSLYQAFDNTYPGTIRKNLSILCSEKKLIRVTPGVFAIPDDTNIFKGHNIGINDIVMAKYLISDENKAIGYFSGINFSNLIGLTSQTASIISIVSNNGPRDKKILKINNRKYEIIRSRVIVTDSNYRLLQVLDLLCDFGLYSEYSLSESYYKIKNYLEGLTLDTNEVEKIVLKFPLMAQLNFYKLGGLNVIT